MAASLGTHGVMKCTAVIPDDCAHGFGRRAAVQTRNTATRAPINKCICQWCGIFWRLECAHATRSLGNPNYHTSPHSRRRPDIPTSQHNRIPHYPTPPTFSSGALAQIFNTRVQAHSSRPSFGLSGLGRPSSFSSPSCSVISTSGSGSRYTRFKRPAPVPLLKALAVWLRSVKSRCRLNHPRRGGLLVSIGERECRHLLKILPRCRTRRLAAEEAGGREGRQGW